MILERYGLEILEIVNYERAKVQLPELRWDTELFDLVGIRLIEINQQYSHTRPDGSPFWTVSSRKLAKGENIALGQMTAKQVMTSWMHSKKHRDNILKCEFKFMAAGTLHSRWVQLLG